MASPKPAPAKARMAGKMTSYASVLKKIEITPRGKPKPLGAGPQYYASNPNHEVVTKPGIPRSNARVGIEKNRRPTKRASSGGGGNQRPY